MTGCADEAAGDELDAGPPPVDQCVSDGDQDLIAMLLVDAGPGANGSAEIGVYFTECAYDSCLHPIISDDGVVECMNDCIDQSEIAVLSEGCRLCYVETIRCVQTNCAVVCLGTDESLCDDCIDTNCDPRLFDCGGFE